MKMITVWILIAIVLLFSSCAIPMTHFTRSVENVPTNEHRFTASGWIGGGNYYWGQGGLSGTNYYPLLSGLGGALHYEYGLHRSLNIGAKAWLDLFNSEAMIGPTIFFQPINFDNFKFHIGFEYAIGFSVMEMYGFNYLMNPKVGIGLPSDFLILGGWADRKSISSEVTTFIDSDGNVSEKRKTEELRHWSIAVGKELKRQQVLMLTLNLEEEFDFFSLEIGVLFPVRRRYR